MLPPVQPAGHHGRPPPHQRNAGKPHWNHRFPPPRLRPAPEACARRGPGTPPAETETTMNKRHSDLVLQITAHDPDTIETT
jgi:hypothetical protein